MTNIKKRIRYQLLDHLEGVLKGEGENFEGVVESFEGLMLMEEVLGVRSL